MGVLANTLAIMVASVLGLLARANIPKKMSQSVVYAIALVVFIMGIDGALATNHISLMIISISLGSVLGEALDLDGRLAALAQQVETHFAPKNSKQSLAEGFIAASLVVCVGSMAVIGSLQSGLQADHSTLYVKSILDAIFCFFLASSHGWGVFFSAFAVFFYQGGIMLLSSWLEPLLSELMIQEMVAVGSLLLIAISLNMLDLIEIRVMNMLPALIIVILVLALVG